jgi:hypothetical protein
MITFKNPKILDGWLPALIGAAAAVGGSALAASSNESIAADANSAAALANDKAWKRQKRMMKNKYQWMKTDLKRAGLNPILAASGGFSAGSVPQAPQQQVFQGHQYPQLDIADSAKDLAESTKVESDIEKNKAEAMNQMDQAYLAREKKGLVTMEERKAWTSILKIEKEFEVMNRQIDLTDENIKLTNKETQKLDVMIKQMTANLAAMQNLDKVYSGPAGQILSYMKVISEALGLSTHGGVGAYKNIK